MKIELRMGPQSGKTALARMLMEGQYAAGTRAVYVAPTQAAAKDAKDRGMPGKCLWLQYFIQSASMCAPVVIFDGCSDKPGFADALAAVERKCQTFTNSQIIVLS